MKTQDSVGIIFVNSVAARGLLNNVINLSLSAYNFTPNDEGQVDPDPAIVCRLRMDKMAATQLRDVLNDLINLMDQAPPPPAKDDESGVVLASSETSH